jgi:hypothetical protein
METVVMQRKYANSISLSDPTLRCSYYCLWLVKQSLGSCLYKRSHYLTPVSVPNYWPILVSVSFVSVPCTNGLKTRKQLWWYVTQIVHPQSMILGRYLRVDSAVYKPPTHATNSRTNTTVAQILVDHPDLFDMAHFPKFYHQHVHGVHVKIPFFSGAPYAFPTTTHSISQSVTDHTHLGWQTLHFCQYLP